MLSDNNRFNGRYRAKVTEVNIDENQYAAIRVFIPEMMTDLDPDYDEDEMGLVAYPANSFIGGQNSDGDDSVNQGSVMVPPLDSYVWIFFENGDPNSPFYTNGFTYKLNETLPENQGSEDSSKVYTLLKTNTGKAIVISDSPDNERVEITGKKADPTKVYEINDNQTVILMDERDGKEKILIKTKKGDYLNIDTVEQKLNIYFKNGITIKTDADFSLDVMGDLIFNTQKNIFMTAKTNIHTKSDSGNINLDGLNVSIRGSSVAVDGGLALGSGASQPAEAAIPVEPKGERD